MEPEPGHLRSVPDDQPEHTSIDSFTSEELDALEAIAQFEVEHRRILAMQTLFYKRRKAGGVA